MPEYIELNMSNYSDEQVSQLNQWAIDAYGEIERLKHELVQHKGDLRQMAAWALAERENESRFYFHDDSSIGRIVERHRNRNH